MSAKFLNHVTNKLFGHHYFRGPYGHKNNEEALNFQRIGDQEKIMQNQSIQQQIAHTKTKQILSITVFVCKIETRLSILVYPGNGGLLKKVV